jgi:hypothetical protein
MLYKYLFYGVSYYVKKYDNLWNVGETYYVGGADVRRKEGWDFRELEWKRNIMEAGIAGLQFYVMGKDFASYYSIGNCDLFGCYGQAFQDI